MYHTFDCKYVHATSVWFGFDAAGGHAIKVIAEQVFLYSPFIFGRW